MAKIKPFKALRPNAEVVSKVAALPYDVYSSKEAREVVKDNELSFLNIFHQGELVVNIHRWGRKEEDSYWRCV